MSATIHYLRPPKPEEPVSAEPEEVHGEPEEPAPEPLRKPRSRWPKRPMPAGRKSGIKRRMDGKVVPREPRSP